MANSLLKILASVFQSSRGRRVLFGGAVLLFLVCRLVSNDLVLNHRAGPPEPDDIYHYFFHTEWISRFGLKEPPAVRSFREDIRSYPGFEDPLNIRLKLTYLQPYFGWNLLLSLADRASGLGLERILQLNFLFGAILATLLAAYLGWVAGWEFAWGLVLVLAVFSGLEAFHGFFWITGSFYTLCIYLFWIALSLHPTRGSDRWPLLGLLLVPLLFVFHQTGWVLTFIFSVGLFLSKALLERDLRSGLKLGSAYLLTLAASAGFYFFLLSRGLFPQVLMDAKTISDNSQSGSFLGWFFSEPIAVIKKFIEVLDWSGPRLFLPSLALLLLPAVYFSKAGRSLALHLALFLGITFLLVAGKSVLFHRFLLYVVPLGFALIGLGFAGLLQNILKKKWPVPMRVGLVAILLLWMAADITNFARAGYTKSKHMGQNPNELERKYDFAPLTQALQALPAGTPVFASLVEIHYHCWKGAWQIRYLWEPLFTEAFIKEKLANAPLIARTIAPNELNQSTLSAMGKKWRVQAKSQDRILLVTP